jgi:hypothetical protein
MRDLWMPDRDLVADLIYIPDPSLGDPYGQGITRCMPRHMRLYVAGHMLSDGNPTKEDFRAAYAIYDGSGTGLLDSPRILTTADVVAEVLQLTSGES